MSGTTPLKVTTAKRDALNLSVIQRHDPSCVHIAHTVTHTVAYEFVSGGWQKLNVEGSLFLVQRASEPLHALIVLNRLGPRNVEVDITASSSVKVSPPFLMVRSAKDGTTYGFWFHDEDERVALEEALQRVRNGSSGAEMAPAVASLLGHGGAQAASGVPVEGEIDEASGRSLMQLLGLTVGGGAALASGSPARSPIPGAAGTASSATAPAAAASSVVSPPGGGGEEAATTVAGDGTPRGRTVVAAASGGGGGAGAGPLMLTKRQLQAMLIKLVQDDKFVDILHRQYMATVQRSRGQSPRS